MPRICAGAGKRPTVARSSVKLPLVEKMTRRFDQAWNLMLMAITLSALATPATAESDSEKERTEDCATAVMTDYVKANDALVCNKPRQLCPLKLRLRSGGSRKSIPYDSCDAASMIRTVLYFEFNSTAASRTKRWKNTGRYRAILIEPTAAQTS